MKKLCIVFLLISSGCIVYRPDRFQLGGEVSIETSGILEYVTGLKLRVFGGIIIERKLSNEERYGTEDVLPIDAFMYSGK